MLSTISLSGSILKPNIFLLTIFIFLKNAYSFGDFRIYMAMACLLGFYIYKKTLGKSIAILLKKLYNSICKRFILWRKKHNDRRKIKKRKYKW